MTMCAALSIVWLLATPIGAEIRDLRPSEARTARGSQTITLQNHKCEFVDTQAACDIENTRTGVNCAVGQVNCSYCKIDLSATNESWYCLRTLEVPCTKNLSGPANDCGVIWTGQCMMGSCNATPTSNPCAAILIDGCVP